MQIQQMPDHHRAGYHFQAPANWMNDPNGVVQWKGRYHLFYQYNPHGPLFGNMHWGHAMSEDLVHWRHLPIALTPTPGTADEDGCWSGCFINNQGTATIIYSGNRAGVQLPCLATSNDDDLVSWEKYAGNPLMPSHGTDLALVEFRDHCVWQEGESWYQIIGSGIKGVGGTALLYQSRDLIHWDYLHPLYIGDRTLTGDMWECPDFFPLGDKYVLLISPIPLGNTHYFIGSYVDHKFTPERHGLLDYGRSFYAPQSMGDERGRRILWGWLREERANEALQQAGWAGMMSLPRILTLDQNGALQQRPAPELASLRDQHEHYADLSLSSTAQQVHTARGAALEISAKFVPRGAQACGLSLHSDGDISEQITLRYAENTLFLDCELAASTLIPKSAPISAHVPLQSGQPLKLHIFLDGSVIEVFANDEVGLTKRIYLSRHQNLSIRAFAQHGKARLAALDMWCMRSIWTEDTAIGITEERW